MKVFNGRAAAEEYMSTHTLTFSSPEMILKKFVLWLGEQVNSPGSKEQTPRLILYIEDKGIDDAFNLMPDTDDTFKPSGAVTDIYSGISSFPSDKISQQKMNSVSKGTTESGVKFCYECGSKLKINSKFCRNCGTKQE
ncbi:MAG: zinc ribbon domain-containing protein [Nitrososphaeraceae archaeon]